MTKNVWDEDGDTQKLFRNVLDAMARPGTLVNIKPSVSKLGFDNNLYLLAIAMTLLDQEVTFHMHGDLKKFDSLLKLHTMARVDSWGKSDYVFVEGTEHFAVNELKKGNLTYPDDSATVICQVERISLHPITGVGVLRFELSGPGIQTKHTVYMDSLLNDTVRDWQDGNSEYPIGMDWILVDTMGQVCCIPRSTEFSWEVM